MMFRLWNHQQELLPTDDDVAFYRAHGWWTSKPILPPEDIAEALAGAERFYGGERDFRLPNAIRRYLDWTPDQPGDLRLNDYVVLQKHEIRRIAFNVVVAACAARLAETPQIRLFNSSLIFKAAGAADTRVGWHVDRAYWRTCTSDKMLTAWMPLHDCDETMGTLCVIDGSHRWPSNSVVDEIRRGRTFLCDDFQALDERLARTGLPSRVVPLELKAGAVSFHHCMLLHGSSANRSRRSRYAIAVHLQDFENRYRRAVDESGNLVVYNNDLMCRRLPDGSPDYSDPTFCPVLWEDPPAGRERNESPSQSQRAAEGQL